MTGQQICLVTHEPHGHPALQSAFGGALKGVQQVGAQDTSATLATVDAHLDMLRPAIANYGGSVAVRAKY